MPIISAVLGVAFKALSKVKKSTWNAMKGAMGAIKDAVNPLANMASIFMFLGPIIRLFGLLFNILGVSIMQAAMPAIKLLMEAFTDPDFIQKITDLGTRIGELIVALITPEFIDTLIELIEGVIDFAMAILTPGFIKTLGTLISAITGLVLSIITHPSFVPALKELALSFIELVGAILAPGFLIGIAVLVAGLVNLAAVVIGALKPVIEFLASLSPSEIAQLFYVLGLGIATLLGFMVGSLPGALAAAAAWAIGMSGLLSFQHGTDFVPQTGFALLHKGEAVLTAKANRRGRGDIIINIDLRNAVIDNVDRLSQRIVEQVMIQIG